MGALSTFLSFIDLNAIMIGIGNRLDGRVRSANIYKGDVPFMRRWYPCRPEGWIHSKDSDPTKLELLRKLLGIEIYLHHIITSDPDPEFHDHPWDSLSLVLAGRITDSQPGLWCESQQQFTRTKHQHLGPGDTIFRRAEQFHRVDIPPVSLIRGGAWTLVIRGKRRKEVWGFRTKDGKIPFDHFLSRRYGSKWADTRNVGG